MGAGWVLNRFFPTFQTERDEYVKALLLFSYLFCVVSASTIGKTAADTLFLSQFDKAALSFMYLPQAVIMIASGILFQRYSPRVPLERLIMFLIPVISLLVLLSRIGIGFELRWVLPTIYIGFDVFNFLMIVCFWQFATSVMDQRKAKRMIGLVGSGGIAGGIASGFGLKAFVPLIGTANLIFVYAGLQLFALGVVFLLNRMFPQQTEARTTTRPPSSSTSGTKRKAGLFKHVPHLKYVAILAAALVFSLQLIDYQFKVILRENLQNDALAGFMGNFYGISGIVALLVQVFVSSWVITRYGVMAALLVFPVILLAGSMGIVMLPILVMAVLVKGSDKVVGDTIYSSVSQLIMFPIPPEWRGKAKSFLDGIARNGAKGLAAVCLLITAQLLDPEQLSYVILVLLCVAIFAAIKLKKAYLQTLISALQAGKHDPERAELNFMDPASRRLLTEAMLSPDRKQALYAFQILRGSTSFDFTPYLTQLLQHPDSKVRMEALALIEQTVPAGFEDQVRRLLSSTKPQVRAKAILALAAYAEEVYSDELTELLEEEDAQIQAATIAALVKYYGIEGMFRSVAKLKLLIESDEADKRMAVASLFGQIGVRSFYKPLVALLADSSAAVRIQAIESAAILQVPALIAPLLQGLLDFETRRHAVHALATYPETEIVPLLRKALDDGSDISLHLPSVFEKIGTQHSFDTLIASYQSANLAMRDRILESLTRMHLKTQFAVRPKEVQQLIEAEVQLFHQFSEHGAPFVDNLRFADAVVIVEQIRSAIARRVFQLLTFLYDTALMQAVYTNWSEGDARQQANASELIDQTVQGPLRSQLLALMAAPRILASHSAAGQDLQTHEQWLVSHGDA